MRGRNAMAIAILGLLIGFSGLELAVAGIGRADIVATICGDGECTTSSLQIDGKFYGGSLLPDGEPLHLGSEVDGLTVMQLFLSGNVDPFQSLGILVLDLGAPSSFSVATGPVPFVPTFTGSYDYIAGLDGSCSGPPPGCGVDPLVGSDIAYYYVNMIEVESRGDSQVVPSPNGDFSGPKYGTVTGSEACGGTCLNLETSIGFMGTGGGDLIGFTSGWEITQVAAVPEPGTIVLTVTGLLLLLAYNVRSGKVRG